MNAESGALAGRRQVKRSIVAILLTMVLFAVCLMFLVDGGVRAILVLAAVGIVGALIRGLPDALVDRASPRRGALYFKTLGYVLPTGGLIVSIYLLWLFWTIRKSELIADLPLEIILGLLAIAGLINLSVLAFGTFSSD